MNRDFVDATRELVEAVIIAQCLPNNGDCIEEMRTVHCAIAVLKIIRASPELASLHKWADRILAEHGDQMPMNEVEDTEAELRQWVENVIRRDDDGSGEV